MPDRGIGRGTLRPRPRTASKKRGKETRRHRTANMQSQDRAPTASPPWWWCGGGRWAKTRVRGASAQVAGVTGRCRKGRGCARGHLQIASFVCEKARLGLHLGFVLHSLRHLLMGHRRTRFLLLLLLLLAHQLHGHHHRLSRRHAGVRIDGPAHHRHAGWWVHLPGSRVLYTSGPVTKAAERVLSRSHTHAHPYTHNQEHTNTHKHNHTYTNKHSHTHNDTHLRLHDAVAWPWVFLASGRLHVFRKVSHALRPRNEMAQW